MHLAIEPREGASFTTEFIGTPKDFDHATEPRAGASNKYSSDVGQVFATVEGIEPAYELTGNELYVRAVITSSQPHYDPSFRDQKQQAWTQPVGWTISD